MSLEISRPAFSAYGLTAVVLSLNLLALWISSGAMRARSGVAMNPEDGVRFKVPVSETEPPQVTRFLRVHRNAEATIYPFLVLGLIYVLADGLPWVAIPIFIVFVLARVTHSIVYLRALQPARTIAFVVCLLATLALIVATSYQVVLTHPQT